MNQQEDFKARTRYVHRALTTLAAYWSEKEGRRKGSRGLRAVFRRWRPTYGGEPTMDMRSTVWSYVPFPADSTAEGNDKGLAPTRFQLETVNRAAVLVALRAMAGDHGGEGVSLGAALQRAGISELRLMRLLGTPRELRIEAMIRALQRVNHERIDIKWTLKETEQVLNFLYGSEEAARWSINAWAGEFFKTRGPVTNDNTTTIPAEQD